MKIGDVIESAIWITGEEPTTLRARYEQDVCNAIDYLCHEYHFIHGPITFIEKLPGTDRAPSVPDHIHGQRVRLLVAEATVTDKVIETSEGSFVANLNHKDLQRLRTIIRRHRMLTDEQCDEIIEQIGPEAALDTLKTLH